MIRVMDPSEVGLIAAFYRDAPDYWLLAEGALDTGAKAAEFFTDCPPNCDPTQSARLGFFWGDRLSGVAELSFGFPSAGDAYLGLMMLGPWAQGAGHGAVFLRAIEEIARAAKSPNLYLAVLDANPRGRAFWLRHGFTPTGLRRHDGGTGHWIERLEKRL
jgi:GNAT superfamily N-acetyltransferase